MKKIILASLVLVVGLSSCVKNSSEYKALQAQRDSLALVNVQNTAEMDEILSILNEVEENFNEIKTAENYLAAQTSAGAELTPTVRERLKSNMNFITETLNKNKEKITELEDRLSKSSVRSSQLEKTLTNLRSQLDEKTEAVAILQDALNRKNVEVAQLTKNVENLSKNVNELESQSQEQLQTIKEQWAQLHTAYYCFGTSKELKEQKILDGSNLGDSFNKGYFTKINDINQFKVLPLYAKKAKMISNHPEGSFVFEKDQDGKMILKILDTASFWSVTKYLVVQVNV